MNIGLLSLDQEKAFDRVNHSFLFKTFGFGYNFVSYIRLMYSMIRVNRSVMRAIRQECPLSGLLYAISIKPLLSPLRKILCGIGVPGYTKIPYDIENIVSFLSIFQKATSACINWEKFYSLLMGDWPILYIKNVNRKSMA